jgi:RNAse (barnase) inhibitor barstar
VREYVLAGSKIEPLEDFYDEVSRVLLPGACWGRNLNAFNDILRGGFGTPKEGFTLRWAHSRASRKALGYSETARQLKRRFAECHALNRETVSIELAHARSGAGPTVFDWLGEIIREHGSGGEQAEDGVRLILD